eukprot:jgi/Mesvir1/10185/Mv16993-RA.1
MKRLRRLITWFKTDFREIVAPSSIPDPPGYPAYRRPTFKEHVEASRLAWKDYVQTWKPDPPPVTEDAAKQEPPEPVETTSKEELMSEIAGASKAGAERLRPALQKLYMVRLANFRDALRQFAEGYREGFSQAYMSKDYFGGFGFPADVAAREREASNAAKTSPPNQAPTVPSGSKRSHVDNP